MLVSVKLETNHANNNGVAWYAYYRGEPEKFDATELAKAASKEKAPLGFEPDAPVEVPDDLSRESGLRRFYVGYGA